MSEARVAEISKSNTNDLEYFQPPLFYVDAGSINPRRMAVNPRALPPITFTLVRGYYPVAGPSSETNLVREPEASLVTAFNEAKSTEWGGRVVRGRVHADINAILGRCQLMLQAIDPSLDSESLAPQTYQSRAVQDSIEFLCTENPELPVQLAVIKEAKRVAIDSLLLEEIDHFKKQRIESRLLDTPTFIAQEARGCVGASFLMVLNSFLHNKINRRAYFNAIRCVYRKSVLTDEEFLKLVCSPTIRRYVDRPIDAFSFTGYDLGGISETAAKLRQKLPGRKIFCIVRMLSGTSESTRDQGVWHSNVLLAAGDTYVTVHDPAFWVRGNNMRVSKDDFLYRWSQAYNSGHFVIG